MLTVMGVIAVTGQNAGPPCKTPWLKEHFGMKPEFFRGQLSGPLIYNQILPTYANMMGFAWHCTSLAGAYLVTCRGDAACSFFSIEDV